MRKLMLSITAVLMSAAMFSTAAFAAFAPSVEQKGAPEVTGAVIMDKDGNEVDTVDIGSITVVPVAEATTLPEEQQVQLTNAYQQLADAADPVAVVPEVADLLSDFNAAEGQEVAAEDLVVKDLFDVTVPDEIMEAGATVAITFNVAVKENQFVVALHNYEDDKWEALPTTNNGDGTVTAVFGSFSPVAIVVGDVAAEGETGETGDKTPTSPQTSDIDFTPWVVMAVVAAGAVVFVARKAHKRG